MKAYYPIMLDITNRDCLILGGGKVAFRKAESLLSYGAKVTVISPALCKEFEAIYKNGTIQWIQRSYQEGDINPYYMVYIATDDGEINQKAYHEAHRKGILVNVVDVPSLCDFIVPAVVKQGDLTLAISTNGKSPMLSRRIREELEKEYGSHYAEFLKLMGGLRERASKELSNIQARTALYEKIVYGEFINRLKQEAPEEILKEIEALLLEELKKREGETL